MNVTPELLEKITRQVVAVLTAGESAGGLEGLLVGGSAWIPSAPGYRWIEEKECREDISPYVMVVCRQISCAQLCDMAMGRDTTPAACAVSKALLADKPVYLVEEGLPHRASQATANPRYYAMLEDYVSRLTQFGVRVVSRAELERLLCVQSSPAKASGPQGTAVPFAGHTAETEFFNGVMTAEEARRLVKTCGGTLRLGRGAILTPLARDVLREKQVELVCGEESLC